MNDAARRWECHLTRLYPFASACTPDAPHRVVWGCEWMAEVECDTCRMTTDHLHDYMIIGCGEARVCCKCAGFGDGECLEGQ